MTTSVHPARLLAEVQTVSLSLAAIDCAEKTGSRFELAEMNDLICGYCDHIKNS